MKKRNRRTGRNTGVIAAAAVTAVLLAVLIFSCSGKDKQNADDDVTDIEAADEKDRNTDREQRLLAETVTVTEEPEGSSDLYGIMYSRILDIDSESGPGSRYTLQDKSDPENAWSVTASDVAFIEAEMKLGAEIAVLYHGDIINDFDNVEIIAMIPDGDYDLKKTEGITVSNLMDSFTVNKNGQTVTFEKDNCHIEPEAMDNDHGDRIIIYYAAGGANGNWPLRVFKAK